MPAIHLGDKEADSKPETATVTIERGFDTTNSDYIDTFIEYVCHGVINVSADTPDMINHAFDGLVFVEFTNEKTIHLQGNIKVVGW